MRGKIKGIIVTVGLIVVLAMGVVPGIPASEVVHAADFTGKCSYCGNVEWKVEGTTITISKAEGATSGDMCYACSPGLYSITDVIIEDGITGIRDNVFSSASTIQNVTIPNSVTYIGKKTFWDCTQLTSIIIPNSVTSIGEMAFSRCRQLKKVTFKSGINITNIEERTFELCEQLESVIFEPGVTITNIGKEAFSACTALASITLPNSVRSIGERAFDGSGLKSMVIPNGVTSLGKGAFSGCSNLETVVVPASITDWGWDVFSNNNSLKNVTLSEGLTGIGTYSFAHCKNLESIKIPASMKSIENSAFTNSGLKSITIPKNIASIGSHAFYGCMNLTDVIIQNGVESIEDYAFFMSGLTSVEIPGSVTGLGESVFGLCEDLAEAKVPYALKDTILNPGTYVFEMENISEPKPKITYTHPACIVTADDTKDIITATCPCGAKSYSATLKAPADTEYTGKVIGASVTNNIPDFNPVIVYTGANLVNGKPVNAGSYVATMSYDDATSVSVKYTITQAPAPAKPHKITNVVSGIHVYWTAEKGVSKYGLWRSENGKNGTYKWIANPTVAHFTDTSVQSGKTYYYKVTTLNTTKNVHSAMSDALGITFVATPDITLRVNRAVGIGLGWQKVDGATGYAIYRKPYSGNASWDRVATINDPNTTTWNDIGVKTANGSVYRYTIRALAGNNQSTLSGCRPAGRTMTRLTSPTLSSTTKASTTGIKCTWSTTAQATGYEVRFMVGNEVYKTYTIGNYKIGTKTFTELKAGKTYKIQVRTYKKVDGVGTFYSAWSTAKTISL